MGLLALAFAVVSAAIMTWGYHELDNTVMDAYVQEQKGGRLQYLTIQGLALAWVTMVLSIFANSMKGWKGFVLRRIKRTIFIISMPLTVVISSIYWSLIFLAPELILKKDPRFTEPSSSEAVPPLARLAFSHDLALHAAPGISLFLDFILFEKPYSGLAAKLGAPLMAILYASGYGAWVEHCAKYNGFFPYPFLTNNEFPIRVGIYGGAATIALVSFWIINGLRSPSKKRSKVE